MIESNSNVCIIAPHPDDETIAMGGSISKFVQMGCNVSILIISGHLPPLYPKESYEKTVSEAKKAFKILGVENYSFAEIPATFVHKELVSDLNSLIKDFLVRNNADVVFLPFPDRHIDHRVIFDASVVCCRPVGNSFPKLVLSYETISETHWNVPGIEPQFAPELFIDISDYMDTKILALSSYESQINNSDSRSIEAIKALARFRGSQNSFKFAEAFKVVRILIR